MTPERLISPDCRARLTPGCSLLAIAGVVTACLTSGAWADTETTEESVALNPPLAATGLPRWEWGVGLAAAYLRDYPGSSHTGAYALPWPWFVWRSDRVEIGREGGRGILYRSAQQELDFTLTANPPSDSGDNPERAGMQALDTVIEPGLRMRWRYTLDDAGKWRLGLALPVRFALAMDSRLRSHALGAHIEPGMSIDRALAPGWNWGASMAVGFAEAGYADYYYGVSAADATPARPLYAAGGGYTGWSVSTRVSYRHDRLSAGVFARLENVADAGFADSPLVTTANGLTVGGNVSWRFGQSREMVAR